MLSERNGLKGYIHTFYANCSKKQSDSVGEQASACYGVGVVRHCVMIKGACTGVSWG